MSLEINSLQKIGGQNPPGIVEVYILPLNSIQDFETLEIKPESNIYYIWLGSSEAGYSDRLNRSDDGDYLSYQLDITVGGKPLHDLESICRYKHILIFRDYLGNMFRVGSKDYPFSCEAQERNSSALNYRLRFSADGSLHFSMAGSPGDAIKPESAGLIDLSPGEGEQTPGIVNATVFFAHQIISLPKLDSTGIMSGDPLILNTAKAWQLSCAELEAGYDITIKKDAKGIYYEQDISIDWPGMKDLDYFNRYKNAYFIVFTKDFKGVQRCFGTLDQPLKASVRTNVAGGRDRNITFSGLTYRRPAVFTGAFETGTLPEPEPIPAGMIDFLEDDFNDQDFL